MQVSGVNFEYIFANGQQYRIDTIEQFEEVLLCMLRCYNNAYDINLVTQELGRKGGKKGGPARAAKLSPERRSEIAKKAAETRWKYKRAEEVSLQKKQ